MSSTSFLGFFYLLLVFLNLLFLGTCIIFFSQVLGLSRDLFFYRYFSVPYFGYRNSFLLQECTGLWTAGCWLARRLHQLKTSTTMDLVDQNWLELNFSVFFC